MLKCYNRYLAAAGLRAGIIAVLCNIRASLCKQPDIKNGTCQKKYILKTYKHESYNRGKRIFHGLRTNKI